MDSRKSPARLRRASSHHSRAYGIGPLSHHQLRGGMARVQGLSCLSGRACVILLHPSIAITSYCATFHKVYNVSSFIATYALRCIDAPHIVHNVSLRAHNYVRFDECAIALAAGQHARRAGCAVDRAPGSGQGGPSASFGIEGPGGRIWAGATTPGVEPSRGRALPGKFFVTPCATGYNGNNKESHPCIHGS